MIEKFCNLHTVKLSPDYSLLLLKHNFFSDKMIFIFTCFSLKCVSDPVIYRDIKIIDNHDNEPFEENVNNPNLEQDSSVSVTEDEFQDPEEVLSDVPEDIAIIVDTKIKTIDPDSASDTTFYSVTSEPNPDEHKVKFGGKFKSEETIEGSDQEDEPVLPVDEEILEYDMSPLKKIQKFFKSRSQEYDVNPGMDITTKYVDLPKVSVNPLYIEQGEMKEEIIDEDSKDSINQSETR